MAHGGRVWRQKVVVYACIVCMFVERHMAAEFGVSRCVFMIEAGLEEVKLWSWERCGNSDACLV